MGNNSIAKVVEWIQFTPLWQGSQFINNVKSCERTASGIQALQKD